MTLEKGKVSTNIYQVLNRLVIFYFNLYAKFILYTRGVNRTEICSARPGINTRILQNLNNGLTIFCGEGGQKFMKILLSMGIICNLIRVQLQTCQILKTKYYF